MSAWQWAGFGLGMLVGFYLLLAWFGAAWHDLRHPRRPRVRWDLETDEPNWESRASKIR